MNGREDEGMEEKVEQQNELQGRKRAKLESNQGREQLDFRRIIHEKFDPQQIKRLVEHLKSLENYYKFVSLEIQHQERSIATLPPHILSIFPELRNRVPTMIAKAKFNVEFLDLVLFPYKPLVIEAIMEEKRRVEEDQSEEICHDHSCRSSHIAITNMFYHMAREWSEYAELQYCVKTIAFLDKYLFSMNGNESKSPSPQKKFRILVVGSGMGRILHQIIKRYGSESIQIQGHEADTELYLCGQYFLNRCTKAHGVYPYLHNFCNFKTNNDPYRCLDLPSTIDDHSYHYPLTLGSFPSLYKTHEGNWDVIITLFANYHVENILMHLRLVYKMLKSEGLWIDVSTSNFDRNIIPFSYREFENVLDRSQFQLLEKGKEENFWYGDPACLMNEMRANYYRVMKK